MRILFALALIVWIGFAYSDVPIQTPRIKTEQKAAQPPEDHGNAKQLPATAVVKPPSNAKTKNPEANARHSGEEGTEFWPQFHGVRIKITDSLLVLFTFILAIFTGLLWNSTHNLWAETKAAGKTTEKAANAANTSAKATMLAERAYVKMSHVSPGVRWIEGNKELFEIEVEVKNHGRTPASVTDVMIGAKLLENGVLLPKPFPYPTRERESIPNAFLVTNETFFHTRTFPLRGQDLADAKCGAKKLWIFGHVDYIDTFNTRHRAGYVRFYIPVVDDGRKNNLFYMTEARYNYDRPRKQGEGNDWDEDRQV